MGRDGDGDGVRVQGSADGWGYGTGGKGRVRNEMWVAIEVGAGGTLAKRACTSLA